MDIYESLGLKPVINAAGTLTKFGGSRMASEVVDAMAAASRSFVVIDELHRAAGERIAGLLGVEAAHVCSSGAAGIVLMAAACLAGRDPARIARLPDTTGMPSRFIVQTVHRNPFDRALRLSGGQFIEIEPHLDALEQALDGSYAGEIAGVFYTFAWFCPLPALPLPVVAGTAHRRGIPVIVDAAAETPPIDNLTRFIREGADLVVFSGGKAIRGPQASGFILGRSDLVEACRLNDSPNMAVGRPMKAGKEEIAGLLKAIELYVGRDHRLDESVWEERVGVLLDALSGLKGVRAWRQLPEGIGQQIPHLALTWEEQAYGLNTAELVSRLIQEEPRIAVQFVYPESYNVPEMKAYEIRIHPHTLEEGEVEIVARRVREILEGL